VFDHAIDHSRLILSTSATDGGPISHGAGPAKKPRRDDPPKAPGRRRRLFAVRRQRERDEARPAHLALTPGL